MKKFFMVAVMAVAALAANAQVFVGGGVGFNYSSSKTDHSESVGTTTFNIAPEIGYQFGNAAVGARFEYNTTKVTDVDAVDDFKVGAFGLYNFVNANKFHFGGELALNYVNAKFAGESVGGFNVALAPVFTYDLSNSVALFSRFDLFSYTKYGEKADNMSNVQFGLFNGAGLNVGVKFNL